jgi:hypothetical protein
VLTPISPRVARPMCEALYELPPFAQVAPIPRLFGGRLPPSRRAKTGRDSIKNCGPVPRLIQSEGTLIQWI